MLCKINHTILKRCVLAFLMLSCAILLVGIRVNGYILDEDGKGIEGAYIRLGSRATRSLRDGSYKIEARGDSLQVSRLGYAKKSVKAKAGRLDVVLKSQPIVLPTVRVSQSYEPYFRAADMLSVPIDPDRHYYSTMDMLGEASGTLSQDTPLKGEHQNVGLLGNLPRHTLVLLDGVPLNADGESFDFSLLDPQNIQSIQIIKNNASVYGGAAAIGGVVMITSKQPSKEADEYKTSLELGSFGYADLRLSLKGGWDWFFYRLALGMFNADNDFSYKPRPWWNQEKDGVRDNNAKQQNSFSLGLGASFKNLLLTLQSELEYYHRQLPGTINFLEVYRNAYLQGHDNRNRLNIESNWNWLNIRGQLWANRSKSLYDNTTAPMAVYKSKYEQQLDKAGVQLSLDKSQGLLRFNTTAAYTYSEYDNHNHIRPKDSIYVTENQGSISLKGGVDKELGDWNIASYLAGRRDFTEKDDLSSGRVELEIKHFGLLQTSFGGTWGTSFAFPSYFDLHWKGDSQAIGNPNLRSETSQGGQVWLDLSGLSYHLRVGAHINTVKDMIQWRQVQMFGNAWKPFNIGKVQLRNLELEGSWDAREWLNLKADALFTDARDISNLPFKEAPKLMYTPKLKYGLKASVSHWNQNIWAKYIYRGEQFITPDNIAAPIEGYDLLDLGWETSFKVWKKTLNLHLKLQNVLNKRYEVYPYIPQPGRAVYFGAQIVF